MIEILTSGVALGVHVPGLLLADRLRERGVPVGVSVLERTVSKPGGGTLLDSLWSATPAILLEPFVAHEQRNADLWDLGFGIPFDTWRAAGFDPELLRPLHGALLTADVPDYSAELA